MRALHLLLLLPAIAPAACFDLPKIDPGPRIVDDFEGPSPTWASFSPWTCDSIAGDAPGTPVPDGGAAAGPVTCRIESPGDGDGHALLAQFTLVDPADGVRQHPRAEIVFAATLGTTVDLNGFTQLVLFAILDGTPPLPSGTQLVVELGCSSFPLDPIASDPVTADVMIGDWVRVALNLADFVQQNTSHNQACLAQIDSLRFTVVPPLTDGQSATGTLQLDNIKLQN